MNEARTGKSAYRTAVRQLYRWVLAAALAGAPLPGARADGDGMMGMGPPWMQSTDEPMGVPPADTRSEASTVGIPQASDSSAPLAALPGFPGTPRIYHLGATGLFLDHPEHITLTAKQQRSLESIKGDAQNEQARYRTLIDSAENELWSLTGAASPDPAAIEHKTHEIEALRHDQRIAYIHAVGLAAEVLTDMQRKQLTGIEPPMPTPIKGK